MATIYIPTPLRPYVDNQDQIEISEGATVGEKLAALSEKYPDIKKNLYDESGTLRKYINVYINDEDIRYLDGADSAAKDSDTISIIPAIAGG